MMRHLARLRDRAEMQKYVSGDAAERVQLNIRMRRYMDALGPHQQSGAFLDRRSVMNG